MPLRLTCASSRQARRTSTTVSSFSASSLMATWSQDRLHSADKEALEQATSLCRCTGTRPGRHAGFEALPGFQLPPDRVSTYEANQAAFK
eukprot:12892082-Prorocentrum_lima.AAC.1